MTMTVMRKDEVHLNQNTEARRMTAARSLKNKRSSNKAAQFFLDCYHQKPLILMVLPGIILVFVFNYLPIFGVVIAFQEFDPIKGFFRSEWVGLKYFKMFLESPYTFRLFRNTLVLGVYSFLWGFPGPIILALLIDQLHKMKFKKIVQTISYLPHFLSVVVIIGIVKEFFSSNGIINELVKAFGGKTIPFLVLPEWFRSLYIGSGLWAGLGWGTIIYLAALSNVDLELHEAAIIDGANRFQRVKYISWPAIVPTITITMIFSISGILGNDFTKVLLLYSPSTYETADVISTYVYREGLQGGRYEYTTAIGLMMNVISFALIVAANQVSRRVSETSLW